MMHAQLLQAQSPPDVAGAREALALGVRRCPTAVPLWIMASRLEEKAGVRIKARALLEKARNLNPKSEEVWLESVKVEERDGSGAAKPMLSRGASSFLLALPCTLDDVLDSYLTRLLPRPQRSRRSPHPASSTRTRSGPSLARRARRARSTRSRRPTTRRLSSSPSRACSGPSARSRRPETGSRGPSPPTRTLATRGRGGGSSRSSTAPTCVSRSSLSLSLCALNAGSS